MPVRKCEKEKNVIFSAFCLSGTKLMVGLLLLAIVFIERSHGQLCQQGEIQAIGVPQCEGSASIWGNANTTVCSAMGSDARKQVKFHSESHSLSSGEIFGFCTTESCNEALGGKVITESEGNVLLDGVLDTTALPGCSCEYHQRVEDIVLFDGSERPCNGGTFEVSFWGWLNSTQLDELKYQSGSLSARGLSRNLLSSTSRRGTNSMFARSKRQRRSSVVSGNTVYVEVSEGGVILIHVDIPLPGTAHIKLGGWNELVNIENNTNHLDIPLEYRLVSNRLYVDVIDADGHTYNAEASVVGEHTCYVRDCIVCWDSLTAWNCLPAGHKWIIGGLVTMMILILLCFFPILLKSIWFILKCFLGMFMCCMRVGKSRGAKKCKTCIKKFVYKMESWFMPETMETTVSTTEMEDGKAKTTVVRRKESMSFSEYQRVQREKMKRGALLEVETEMCLVPGKVRHKNISSAQDVLKVTVMMALCLLFAMILNVGAINCDTTIIGQSELHSCTVTGTTKDCTIEYDIEIDLNAVHDVACVVFQDTNDNMIHHVAVQLTQQEHITEMEYVYLTSDWEGVYEADHKCAEANKCSAAKCLETSDSNDPSAAGLLTGIGQTLPGETHCTPGCGCAGCGCLVCSDSCHFYRTAFDPVGDQYLVYDPTGMTIENHMSVTIMHPDGTEDSAIPMLFEDREEVTVNLGSDDIYVTAIGTFDSGTTIWGSHKILFDTGSLLPFVGEAAEANSPQQGIYGDIQYSTIPANDANTVYSSDLATVTVDRHLSNAHFADSPFTLGVELDELPHVRGEVNWNNFEFDVLRGDPVTAAPVLVRIHTGSDGLQISYETGIVCPEFSIIEVTGCCECDSGGEIKISARSKCDAGAATVRLSEGYEERTKVVSLTTQFQTFEILFDTDDCHPAGTIELFHGEKNEIKDFNGDLMMKVSVHPGNGTDIEAVGNPFSDGFGVRFTTGKMHWHEWLIIAGAVIVLIIALVAGIAGCRSRWSKMMSKKTM